MDPKITIRPETLVDTDEIFELTVIAFNTLAISDHTEQFIIEALRRSQALTLSLVADLGDRLVGHIAFSPVGIAGGATGWYGLGPVSVLPEYQRQGIGSALIKEGLSQLKALGAKGCCLVGHPTYYGRFGFTNPAELKHEGVPAEAFFALAFDGPMPEGTVTFHQAFLAKGPV